MEKSNTQTAPNKLTLNKLDNFDRDRGCFACGADNPIGLKMEFYSDGQTVFSWLTVSRRLCGWRNIIHGCIITTIMDEAMSWTAHHLIKKRYYCPIKLEFDCVLPKYIAKNAMFKTFSTP